MGQGPTQFTATASVLIVNEAERRRKALGVTCGGPGTFVSQPDSHYAPDGDTWPQAPAGREMPSCPLGLHLQERRWPDAVDTQGGRPSREAQGLWGIKCRGRRRAHSSLCPVRPRPVATWFPPPSTWRPPFLLPSRAHDVEEPLGPAVHLLRHAQAICSFRLLRIKLPCSFTHGVLCDRSCSFV